MRIVVMECNQRMLDFPDKDIEIGELGQTQANNVRKMLFATLNSIGCSPLRDVRIETLRMLYNDRDITTSNHLTINEVEALASLSQTPYLGEIRNFVSAIRLNPESYS